MSVRPEDVGLCSERLARIDTHLKNRYLDPGKIAGASTLVYRRGQLAWLSPIGLMDRERGKPMAEDTIFRIYSMTKPITCVALMTLYEHGHFHLDDPVYKLIPEWRDGLTYGFMERTNVDRAYRKLGIGSFGKPARGDLRHMIELLTELPLEFSPGTAWNYSVSTDVCAHLVEVISGERFDAYLRRHIFEPLGMRETGFFVPEGEVERFAASYDRDANKRLRLLDDPQKSAYLQPPEFLSGGGGLVSTTADYLRFCRMLLGGGQLDGTRILGRKTLELMTRNHLPGGKDLTQASVGLFSEGPMAGRGFGLGFSVQLDPVNSGVVGSPGEYAWGGAASTYFWVDPAEELIVIFMTQLFPSQTFNFRDQLRAIIYPAIID